MRILIRDEAGIRELEEGYASESELQRFLMAHANLMPLEDIDLTSPPLLCIGWEVGVVSGAEDILYIDSSGLLTVVETKLRRNPESRRAVVGQILEYAAQMAAWSSSDVERQAERFFASVHSPAELRGQSLRQAMESHSALNGDEGFDYELFLEAIQQRIDGGHFRLVIAIDEPPEPLLKTAEFVNRFSRHFELYLVHLKRFSDTSTKADIFVPAVFGKVAAPPSESGIRSTRYWDHDAFFKDLESRTGGLYVERITDILDRLKHLTDEDQPWGGTETTHGLFNLVVNTGDRSVNLAAVRSSGVLVIGFGALFQHGFTEVANQLAAALRSIPGVELPSDLSHKWPGLKADALADVASRQRIVQALEDAVNQLKSESDDTH